MKLTIGTYERLLQLRVIRAEYSVVAYIAAGYFRVMADPYRQLACLLRNWRTLASVPPHVIPTCIRERATRLIFGLADPAARARYLGAFLRQQRAVNWLAEFSQFDPEHRVRLRYPRDDGDRLRQGDLLILKPPVNDSEKGVILIKYSPSIAKFVAVFDHKKLAERYRFVLEPSTWGYQDPDFLLYLHLPADVLVQSQYGPDFEYIDSLGHNLLPVRVGAGDWVDASRFTYTADWQKLYDVVMVASWQKLKRHELLFRVLDQLGDRIARVALIGYPASGRTIEHVTAEAHSAGVYDKIDWFEKVSHQRVSELLQQSRVSLMLSTREGASRVIYESLFCNVPVILTSRNIGVNRAHVNTQTGIVAADEDLADAIVSVLDDSGHFSPREWALANTGYLNATRIIQDKLKEAAARSGEPWTMDILPKVNAPNLRYASEADWELAQPWYADLKPYLRQPAISTSRKRWVF